METERHIERICVFGVGGVGGYFGGSIVHALSLSEGPNPETYFIARGEHLQAIREHGLLLETSAHGRVVCRPTLATDSMADIPVPDLVLLCVKSYGLDAATRQIRAHMSEDTVILPLLNGVDVYERLRATIDRGIVLPACVYVGTHIERPGMVVQGGGDGVIIFGPDPRCPDVMPHGLRELLDSTGIAYRYADDPYPAIWEKYLFIASLGLVTAASGKTLDAVLADSELRADVVGIMREVESLAECEGVILPEGAVQVALARADGFPPGAQTSFQRDVERGGDNEKDLFAGTILRLGKRHGIATPTTERIASSL